MKAETQFSITIDDETLNKIKPMFKRAGKFNFKNTVYALVISVKVGLHLNRKNVYLKKINDDSYSVSFCNTNELIESMPRRTRNNIIAESTKLTLTVAELKEMIAPYNIWLVNNKVKSTNKEALQKFYEIHINENIFKDFE
jgi:hypothetical protein